MMFPNLTKEVNEPCGGDQFSNMGLPINYPTLVWPINYSTTLAWQKGYLTRVWPEGSPTLAWLPSQESIALALRQPTFIWAINISNHSILKHMTNQAVLPWPLYAPNFGAFWPNRIQTDPLDLAVVRANHQSEQLDKAYHSNHKIDLALDPTLDQSSEQVTSVCSNHNHDLIVSLLSEKIVQQNIVTNVKVTEDMITVYISPVISSTYVRPDCKNPTTVNYYDSNPITVQGLGIQGKAVRYVVNMVRLRYMNDKMTFRVFTANVPGIRRDIKVTDEVVEASMYFIIDRNLSLRVTAEVLDDLYRIETSSSALDRWKINSACALPSIGQLIQQLNAKKAITQLHLDEYKATGTKSWELCVKDEHCASRPLGG